MGKTRRSQSLLPKEGDGATITATGSPAASPESDSESDGYLSEELGLELPTRLSSKRVHRSKETYEARESKRAKRKSPEEEKTPVEEKTLVEDKTFAEVKTIVEEKAPPKRRRTRDSIAIAEGDRFLQPQLPHSSRREIALRATCVPIIMEQKSKTTATAEKVEPVGIQERTMMYMTKTETTVPEAPASTSTAIYDFRDMSKAPHFPQQPVARQNEDGSLELECYVDANPKPEIKWFYDNKEVKPDGRFSLKLDTRGNDQYSAILTIKDLADSDAGAYRCAIVNPHGKGNANFNLKLTGFSSPTFVEKPQISSRDDGQIMVMEFRAKSILKPVFVWSKGDEIVSPSDRVHVVLREEPNQIYYAALEIKDPTKEKDAGQFVCTAKNDSGKLTATFTVKFEVPQGAPTFTRKPQILQKTSDSGDPAIVFDIGYQADRNPEVIWINPKGKKMKESSRIKFATSSDGGSNTYTATLELKNYKAKDSGTYTCNIKNDAGEANVELTLNIEGPMDDGADENSDA